MITKYGLPLHLIFLYCSWHYVIPSNKHLMQILPLLDNASYIDNLKNSVEMLI